MSALMMLAKVSVNFTSHTASVVSVFLYFSICHPAQSVVGFYSI